jgi:glutathione-regulated potassium-efflux system ancillary protein KefG
LTKRRVLVLFAHPAFEKSKVNRALVGEVQPLEGVTFHDLYEAYPDFDIQIQKEQELLAKHDVIVLQHPFFWYSTPALLKEWMDLVFQHGWAYGHEGKALHGKLVLSAITTGGRDEAYRRGGHNRFSMRELLAPIEQTTRLCGMEYLPPFVAHGSHSMGPEDVARYAADYRRVLVALRDDRIDLDKARSQDILNPHLSEILRGERG